MKKLLAVFLGIFLFASHLSAAASDSSLLESTFPSEQDTPIPEAHDGEGNRECFCCGLIKRFFEEGNAVGAKGYINIRCDDIDILEKLVPPRQHVCRINKCLTIRLVINMSDDVWKIILYPSGRYGVMIYGAQATFSKHISDATYLDGSPQDFNGEEPITVYWELDGEKLTFF